MKLKSSLWSKFSITTAVIAVAGLGALYADSSRARMPRPRPNIAIETATTGDEVVPGRVLLKLRKPLRPAVRDFMQFHGVALEGLLDGGVEMISMPALLPADLLAEAFRELDEVEFAEPDYVVHLDAAVNDPKLRTQWHVDKIKTPQAWNISDGLSSVVIAVCDTGVDPMHSDLQGKLVPGYNYISNNTNTTDDHGHGTHVAGIAAADTNNAVGIAGIGYRCNIMPVKVLDATGTGSWSSVASGISFASLNGAKVINLSLGGSAGSQSLLNAINLAVDRGSVVIAAAGNSGVSTEHFPAAYTNCIAVGASTPTDGRASFSNYGLSWVDVAAPGSSIVSTFPTYTVTMGSNATGYTTLSGTSMATPVVAGVAGLLYAYLGASARPASVRSLIESTCDPIANTWTSSGRVDAFAALSKAATPAGRFNGTPQSIIVKSGRWRAGDASSIVSVDQSSFETLSAGARGTRSMGIEADIGGLSGTLLSLDVKITSSASAFAEQTILVFNWQRRKFDALDTASLSTAASERTLNLGSNAATYVKNGLLRVRVQATAQISFVHSVDAVIASAIGS
ncbi:MAG: S8 family peptidase [Planctomycetota bacterium]